jgi:hypothetical protein
MAKHSDVVFRQRGKTQSMWLKLELLVSAVEDNLPLLEEALADAKAYVLEHLKR